MAPGDAEAMAKAIIELAADPNRRRRLGDIARQLAEDHLDRETIIARYEQRLSWLVVGAAEGARAPAGAGQMAPRGRPPGRPYPGTVTARMSAHFRYDNVRLRFEYWPVIWLWPVSLVLMQVDLGRDRRFFGHGRRDRLPSAAAASRHVLLAATGRPDWQTTMALAILALRLPSPACSRGILGSSCAASRTSPISCSRWLICLNVRIGRGEEVARSLARVLRAGRGRGAAAHRPGDQLQPACAIFASPARWATSRLLAPAARSTRPAFRAALPRANGLYSEPSVAGWFMTFAVAMALAARPLHPAIGTAHGGAVLARARWRRSA